MIRKNINFYDEKGVLEMFAHTLESIAETHFGVTDEETAMMMSREDAAAMRRHVNSAAAFANGHGLGSFAEAGTTRAAARLFHAMCLAAATKNIELVAAGKAVAA